VELVSSVNRVRAVHILKESSERQIMAIRLGNTTTWTKSSYSGGNGACVEVASRAVTTVSVRDSKDPQGPALGFTPESWTAFVADVSRGAFDLG
jgi:Domain of unknown function (DUF397)